MSARAHSENLTKENFSCLCFSRSACQWRSHTHTHTHTHTGRGTDAHSHSVNFFCPQSGFENVVVVVVAVRSSGSERRCRSRRRFRVEQDRGDPVVRQCRAYRRDRDLWRRFVSSRALFHERCPQQGFLFRRPFLAAASQIVCPRLPLWTRHTRNANTLVDLYTHTHTHTHRTACTRN